MNMARDASRLARSASVIRTHSHLTWSENEVPKTHEFVLWEQSATRDRGTSLPTDPEQRKRYHDHWLQQLTIRVL